MNILTTNKPQPFSDSNLLKVLYITHSIDKLLFFHINSHLTYKENSSQDSMSFDIQQFYMKTYELCMERKNKELSYTIIKHVNKRISDILYSLYIKELNSTNTVDSNCIIEVESINLNENLDCNIETSISSLLKVVSCLYKDYLLSVKKICNGLVYLENKMQITSPNFKFLFFFDQIFLERAFFLLVNKKTELISTIKKELYLFRLKKQNYLSDFLKFIMRFENFIEIVKMNSNLHSKIDDALDLEKILYSNLDLTKDKEKEKESEETSPFQIQIENEVFEFISCKNYKYHSVYININTLILSFSAFYDDLLNTIFKETLSFYADFYSTHKEKNDFSNYFSYIEDSLANINREEDTFSILNKKDLYKIVSIIFNELILMDNKFIFSYFNHIISSLELGNPDVYNEKHVKTIKTIYFIYGKNFDSEISSLFFSHFNNLIKDFLSELVLDYENTYNLISNKKQSASSQVTSSHSEQYRTIRELIEKTVRKRSLFSKFVSVFLSDEKVTDNKLDSIIKAQFEKIVNMKNGFFVKRFINFCHEEIKLAALKQGKIENQSELSNVFLVFYKLIQEKDLFEKEYRENLSKRLLRNSSMMKETEFSFLDVMRKESGKNFVKKMEIMIQDIYLSRQLSLEFCSKKLFSNTNSRVPSRHTSKTNNLYSLNIQSSMSISNIISEKRIDFSVKLVDTENWPVNKKAFFSFYVPNEITNISIQFHDLYKSKNKGKSLVFLNQLSWYEAEMSLNKKKYLLVCTGIQMSIFSLINSNFSSGKRFSYKQLISLLAFERIDKERKMEETELNHQIHSILDSEMTNLIGKGIIFKRKDEENEKETYFQLNRSFASSEYKIVLNKQKGKAFDENEKKEKEVCSMVIEDRKYKIDASVMRIIKSKKVIDFSSLLTEVGDVLSKYFPLEVSLLKMRIENLIDRNLVCRDEENSDLFKYSN